VNRHAALVRSVKVFLSCRTLEQLKTAEKYFGLAAKRHQAKYEWSPQVYGPILNVMEQKKKELESEGVK